MNLMAVSFVITAPFIKMYPAVHSWIHLSLSLLIVVSISILVSILILCYVLKCFIFQLVVGHWQFLSGWKKLPLYILQKEQLLKKKIICLKFYSEFYRFILNSLLHWILKDGLWFQASIVVLTWQNCHVFLSLVVCCDDISTYQIPSV